MPVKGHDNGNNLHDVYTTNEVLSILQQAIDSGSMQGIDPSINPVVEAVKESHANNNLTFWQGTEAEFNALGISGEILGCKIDENGKIYVLTGDTTLSDAVANAAAAAEAVLEDKVNKSYVEGEVLYTNDSGTTGSITFNADLSEFKYLMIEYKKSDENFHYVQKFPALPNIKFSILMDLSFNGWGGDVRFLASKAFDFVSSENNTQTLNIFSVCRTFIFADNSVGQGHDDFVAVTKIIGTQL